MKKSTQIIISIGSIITAIGAGLALSLLLPNNNLLGGESTKEIKTENTYNIETLDESMIYKVEKNENNEKKLKEVNSQYISNEKVARDYISKGLVGQNENTDAKNYQNLEELSLNSIYRRDKKGSTNSLVDVTDSYNLKSESILNTELEKRYILKSETPTQTEAPTEIKIESGKLYNPKTINSKVELGDDVSDEYIKKSEIEKNQLLSFESQTPELENSYNLKDVSDQYLLRSDVDGDYNLKSESILNTKLEQEYNLKSESITNDDLTNNYIEKSTLTKRYYKNNAGSLSELTLPLTGIYQASTGDDWLKSDVSNQYFKKTDFNSNELYKRTGTGDETTLTPFDPLVSYNLKTDSKTNEIVSNLYNLKTESILNTELEQNYYEKSEATLNSEIEKTSIPKNTITTGNLYLASGSGNNVNLGSDVSNQYIKKSDIDRGVIYKVYPEEGDDNTNKELVPYDISNLIDLSDFDDGGLYLGKYDDTTNKVTLGSDVSNQYNLKTESILKNTLEETQLYKPTGVDNDLELSVVTNQYNLKTESILKNTLTTTKLYKPSGSGDDLELEDVTNQYNLKSDSFLRTDIIRSPQVSETDVTTTSIYKLVTNPSQPENNRLLDVTLDFVDTTTLVDDRIYEKNGRDLKDVGANYIKKSDLDSGSIYFINSEHTEYKKEIVKLTKDSYILTKKKLKGDITYNSDQYDINGVWIVWHNRLTKVTKINSNTKITLLLRTDHKSDTDRLHMFAIDINLSLLTLASGVTTNLLIAGTIENKRVYTGLKTGTRIYKSPSEELSLRGFTPSDQTTITTNVGTNINDILLPAAKYLETEAD